MSVNKMTSKMMYVPPMDFEAAADFFDFRAPMPVRPKIAVLLPAYNAGKWLEQCLSALDSSHVAHDLVIVDDGSVVPVRRADLGAYSDRSVVVRMKQNSGIVAALNTGASFIIEQGYSYVARQDADDLSCPCRLDAQADFMDKNPDVGLCGTSAIVIDEFGNERGRYLTRSSHQAIVNSLPFANQFVHTTLFIRSRCLLAVGLYDQRFEGSEDYDLAFRMTKRYRVANLREFLSKYRVHSGSISSNRYRQVKSSLGVALHHFDYGNWRAYAGVSKKLLGALLPRAFIVFVKLKR